MKKPLLAENLMAEEYNYLYTDNDNMNYYSAKQYDDYYVLPDFCLLILCCQSVFFCFFVYAAFSPFGLFL